MLTFFVCWYTISLYFRKERSKVANYSSKNIMMMDMMMCMGAMCMFVVAKKSGSPRFISD